jgi:tRNA pseudouridine32 synthase / 23S rRNA pseudouridine746 synthase
MTPEDMVSRVLYRDGLMLVIDKPAGFAVHRGPKGGESLEDHFHALRFGLPRAPALAHRLDRETSGCLVLGRHRKALAALGQMFKQGRVGKTYWAVVEGGPGEDEGRTELPLGRLDATRGWWMKPDPNGRPAVTVWRVLGRSAASPNTEPHGFPPEAAAPALPNGEAAALGFPPPLWGRDREGGVLNHSAFGTTPHPNPPPQGGREPAVLAARSSPAAASRESGVRQLTWLALEPLTGRTHQLRVHCAAMGWPILGDAIYGTAPRTGGPGLHLHSREVIVPIAKNREPVRVIAPVPPHMRERLSACGWSDAHGQVGEIAPTAA